MVDGKQMTVAFHVDDGMLSHKSPLRVTEFLQGLDKIYTTKLTHSPYDEDPCIYEYTSE